MSARSVTAGLCAARPAARPASRRARLAAPVRATADKPEGTSAVADSPEEVRVGSSLGGWVRSWLDWVRVVGDGAPAACDGMRRQLSTVRKHSTVGSCYHGPAQPPSQSQPDSFVCSHMPPSQPPSLPCGPLPNHRRPPPPPPSAGHRHHPPGQHQRPQAGDPRLGLLRIFSDHRTADGLLWCVGLFSVLAHPRTNRQGLRQQCTVASQPPPVAAP